MLLTPRAAATRIQSFLQTFLSPSVQKVSPFPDLDLLPKQQGPRGWWNNLFHTCTVVNPYLNTLGNRTRNFETANIAFVFVQNKSERNINIGLVLVYYDKDPLFQDINNRAVQLFRSTKDTYRVYGAIPEDMGPCGNIPLNEHLAEDVRVFRNFEFLNSEHDGRGPRLAKPCEEPGKERGKKFSALNFHLLCFCISFWNAPDASATLIFMAFDTPAAGRGTCRNIPIAVPYFSDFCSCSSNGPFTHGTAMILRRKP